MAEVTRIKTNQTTTYEISGDRKTYVFDAASSITMANVCFHIDQTASNNTLRIEGMLHTDTDKTALDIVGRGTRLFVEDTGFLYGDTAIRAESDIKLRNTGTIQGMDAAIDLDGSGGEIVNRASIHGENYGVKQSGDGKFSFENHGELTAYIGLAVEASEVSITLGAKSEIFARQAIASGSSGTVDIVNHGRIAAHGGVAFTAADGQDTLVNTGSIFGTIFFGGQDDRFVNKGRFEGQIFGGQGDDVIVLNRATNVIEFADEGTDTVRISVGYTLDPNIEKLILTGARDLRGAGNDGDNVIKGNAGDNKLAGGFGTDTLSGGAGRDDFLYRVDGGADTIRDFRPGQDQIRISGYDLYTEFRDLDISQAGKNVRLSFADEAANDVIILENLRVKDIDAGDFLFA